MLQVSQSFPDNTGRIVLVDISMDNVWEEIEVDQKHTTVHKVLTGDFLQFSHLLNYW